MDGKFISFERDGFWSVMAISLIVIIITTLFFSSVSYENGIREGQLQFYKQHDEHKPASK